MPAKGKGKGKAAAGHQHASTLPKGTEMKDLRKKLWFLGEPIGSGGFGLIYLADDDKNGATKEKANYVIKVEPQGNGPLYCEIAFYQRAARSQALADWKKKSRMPYVGIPEYVAHGLYTNGKEDLRFMVMPRFGTDIHSLWLKANKRFKRATVSQLAIELINSLQYMHENDYVHADVKGANILLGHKNPNQIYLVDFGLAYRYLVDGNHKDYFEDPRKAHDGTIEYTSRDAHLGVVPSRRSDLEILGYALLHWLSGKLPWEDNLANKNYVKDSKIKHMKKVKEFVASVYPEAKSSKACEIEKFLDYVSKLEYDEEPDYDLLRGYFQNALKSMGVPLKSKIDFGCEEEVSAPTPSKKKRTQPKAKPLISATNSQTSQSDEEFAPKKKTRRAPAKRKQISSTEEEDPSSLDYESSASEETPAKKSKSKRKPVSSVKKTVPKKRNTKKIPTVVEPSSEERSISEYTTDENCLVPISGPSKKINGAPKRVTGRGKNQRTTSEESVAGSSSAMTENEVDITGTTMDSPSPKPQRVTRNSSGKNKSPSESAKPSMKKSRYSMAPLHTESVLGKNDKLSGKQSGKHPVIIRRRKVNRPKTDAVTQTTPGLRKTSSRV